MNVLFVQPPAAHRVGGIDTALSGLAQAVAPADVHVERVETLHADAAAHADLVHFHGLWERAHISARRRCVAANTPFLISPHGMLEPWAFQHRGWKKWPYFHLIERPSFKAAKAILATSDAEATQLARWFPRPQIRVLSLGGDLPPSGNRDTARGGIGVRPEELVILFLSRCHEKKGLHLLIDALPAAARAAGRSVRLLVVGDGDPAYVNPLRSATTRWTGNLRCTWAGACWGQEKWRYLHAADLLCLPSFSENFGLAVLEALFAGTPVLTTTGTPWASLRGALPVETIPPTTKDLQTALARFLIQPPPTDAVRQNTRSLAQAMFGWPALAPRYVALYRELARA
nr:glycosyltransferase [Opitutus sp. ER46]